MRRTQRRFSWLSTSILGVLTLSPVLLGQASPDSEAGAPVTTDWSHHHLIFSRPGTPEQAERVQQDPRYWQQLHRQVPAILTDEETGGAGATESQLGATRPDATRPDKNSQIQGDWSQDMGSGATVGARNYPAKYSFNTSIASCASDFVVYGTGLLGSAGQASVVAYNNIYSGCGGTVPSVYWAYNTVGTTVTSPVFSRDGTQVAFVQSGDGYKSTIALVKWAASASETITSPLTILQVFSGAYPACPAPCMTTLHLRDGSGTVVDKDSNSSIFYDYSADTAYVGDDAGWLHQITPFFLGKPVEVRTGGWPVQVNTTTPTALTSPVHDYASGNVFVADAGGFLYRVDPSGAVTTSGRLDFSRAEGGAGIVQGPVIDSVAALVYVFASSDGSGSCIGGTDCTAVYQLSASFIGGGTGTEAVVGASTISGKAPSPLYLGAFDSAYKNSVAPPSGNIYVCGNTGGPPILYQIPIAAGSFGTVNPGPALSTSAGITPCSPVTDVLNPNASGGATEWMFASAKNGGTSSGCSGGGCIFNFKDTAWKPATAYSLGQEVLDGHFQIQVVSKAGTSGAAAPIWKVTAGKTTNDASVRWVDQGVQSASTPAGWKRLHVYSKGQRILDSHDNIQLVTAAGTSGGSLPAFNSTAGLTTSDGTVTWTNVGALATTAMPAAGGTSGMIIDNTVGSGTMAGASQIYFSTLSDQICGVSVTPGGCAVQASQSTLQ
jgi:hypothetical protein